MLETFKHFDTVCCKSFEVEMFHGFCGLTVNHETSSEIFSY